VGKLTAALAAWGAPGAFLLALLDSAGVPLPTGVDALVILTAMSNPAQAYLAAACASFGSLIGALILFWMGRKGGELYLRKHTESARAKKFREWFNQYGLVTVFVPKLLVIPLPTKVFVLSAGVMQAPPVRFAAVVLAARIPRYFGLAYLGTQMGESTLPWIQAHARHIAGIAVLLVAALFVLIRQAGRTPASR
jgi:membrane protein YqaA with SNARE-associated domain